MKRRDFITLLWLLMVSQSTSAWAQEDHVVRAKTSSSSRADACRLNAEVNAIVNTAEVKQQLVNLGVNPIGRGSLDELQAFVKTEVVRWGKVLQEAGLAGSE